MKVHHNIFLRPKTIVLTAAVSMILISLIVYLNPENQGWWKSPDFSWSNLLGFLFIDQILFECFSVFITFFLAKKYADRFVQKRIQLNRKGIINYQLRFLPVALLAFFFFNPVTQSLRFLYHYFPSYDPNEYFSDYFYSIDLFLTYLPVVFLQLYAVININLFRQYAAFRQQKADPSTVNKKFIEVRNSKGKRLLSPEEIHFCEKKGRKYYLQTGNDRYETGYTLSELEQILDPLTFVRVNRASMVNLSEIDHYAYWEHDKYILLLKSGQEFVMSRKRLKGIRDRMVNKA